MALNREAFEARVKQLEDFARRDPGGYRTRVTLLAMLGFGYILTIFAASLGLLLYLIWYAFDSGLNSGSIRILIYLGIFNVIMLRSLWVKIPAPEGLELKRADYPALFAMVEEVAAQLKAPVPARILLTDDFNAAVVQRPRFGLLGGNVNYLILGLPYLQGSPPEQVRGVVAHELGHLSGNHSRFAGRIYRVRRTWSQLLQSFAKSRSWGIYLFLKFFQWYAPFFNLYTFVLARADEYVADKCAVEVVGAPTMAASLVSVSLKARYLGEKLWPDVYKQVRQLPKPPNDIFKGLASSLRSGLPHDKAVKWLREGLRAQTDFDDTHPCLADRLNAMGMLSEAQTQAVLAQNAGTIAADWDIGVSEPLLQLVPPVSESAADRYLGRRVDALTLQMDVKWRDAVGTAWSQRFFKAKEAQEQLEMLNRKAMFQPLTREETWQRMRLTAEFKTNLETIPLMQQIVANEPNNAEAHFGLGQLLLEEEDPRGIAHIEQAMIIEPQGTPSAARRFTATSSATSAMRKPKGIALASSSLSSRNPAANVKNDGIEMPSLFPFLPVYMKKQSFDPIQVEVWRHLLASIAEEMGATLERTAYSPNIKERLDHSCAVFDAQGRLLAQAAHIPVHLGAMPLMLQTLLPVVAWKPGVMWLCNDPRFGGTHLPDLTLVAPVYAKAGMRDKGLGIREEGKGKREEDIQVFGYSGVQDEEGIRKESGSQKPADSKQEEESSSLFPFPSSLVPCSSLVPELLGFVASRAHHADIGGLSPGSLPLSTELFHEGLIISAGASGGKWGRARGYSGMGLRQFAHAAGAPGRPERADCCQ